MDIENREAGYKKILKEYDDVFTVQEYEPIKNHTTVKLGGLARLFITVRNIFPEETKQAIQQANTIASVLSIFEESTNNLTRCIADIQKYNLPYHIIGGGSDSLFASKPYDGIVIKLSGIHAYELPSTKAEPLEEMFPLHIARHTKVLDTKQKHDLSFDDLYFTENHDNPTYFFAEAGCGISYLIPFTLSKNLSGLHWFSHIPASVGGALYNNIHGGKIMFSEYIAYVAILDKDGKIAIMKREDMEFGYDTSYLQKHKAIALGAIFVLYTQNDIEIQKAKDFSRQWISQKILVQPQAYTAGSTFKNITEEERFRIDVPSNSAGYLIDKAGLKGYQIGGAKIYEEHGNFFINTGDATSEDYKKLIEYAIEKVEEKFGVRLEPEIKFFNFD